MGNILGSKNDESDNDSYTTSESEINSSLEGDLTPVKRYNNSSNDIEIPQKRRRLSAESDSEQEQDQEEEEEYSSLSEEEQEQKSDEMKCYEQGLERWDTDYCGGDTNNCNLYPQETEKEWMLGDILVSMSCLDNDNQCNHYVLKHCSPMILSREKIYNLFICQGYVVPDHFCN